MKRVGIFTLAYLPHIGGAEVALKEITDRIPSIEFHVFTMNFGKEAREERVGNVSMHRVGNGSSYLSKILFAPRAALAAYRVHRTQPFDAYWAMMSYMLLPIVLMRCVGVRIPYLLTLQEGDPWEHMFSRWFILPFRPLLAAGFKHASAVQAISTYLARWAERMGYTGGVEVIPNGCDTARFAESHMRQDRELFWKQKNVTGTDTILITTSRLVHKNAIDVVIRSLVLLPKNIRFVVLGDGEDRVMLEALARSLGVADRVHFLGAVSNSDAPQYLHASDIFIRPSRTEGMGISFVEAMAAGLPVIATQEGGISDFLFDAKRNPDKMPTGWAVDADSSEQVAAAIKEILASPEQVVRVTANAKKLVSEKYDWDLIAECMTALFDRLSKSQ